MRWEVGLPAVAAVISAALVLLALTAASALRDRHALAVDGRVFRLGQRVERQLRDEGQEAAPQVLASELAAEAGFVVGLAVGGGVGAWEHEAGLAGAAGWRELDLFLGPGWAGGGPGWRRGAGARGEDRPRGRGGRRVLGVALAPAAAAPPAVARLLVPAAVVAGAILVGLAVLGGRLLARQREEAAREGERRRLEGLARAGAGLAHQLRTPLATIKGSCQLLEEGAPAGGKRLATILEQTERMDRLLTRLLDYARPPQPEPRAVELRPALAELGERYPQLELAVPSGLAAWADPDHLEHVLANVVDNAASFSSHGGAVRVAAAVRAGWAEIRVADDGPGPGEDPEQLFEPYFTSRADGTGLGLPIARALAEANGGSLHLEAGPGGGTVAVLRLPGPPAGEGP